MPSRLPAEPFQPTDAPTQGRNEPGAPHPLSDYFKNRDAAKVLNHPWKELRRDMFAAVIRAILNLSRRWHGASGYNARPAGTPAFTSRVTG
jgi:hypothetical protein